MHSVRRSAALTLLLLLAVTLGPLLCRTGGDQAWTATATATSPVSVQHTPQLSGTPKISVSSRFSGSSKPVGTPKPFGDPQLLGDPQLSAGGGSDAEAHAPKRCSGQHAPAPDESAPPPAPHRAEPLAPATTGPGSLAADLPAQHALARPPTQAEHRADHPSLLPVLRI
ncbi:hypothetical protein SSP35_01_08970 [Streptomyces sp. NBRC 110611]|uniref:hypothetical protein n=1 Tax=Streptomyces sp. NBRC 110611 TaxID=1621259 RepID=UPI000833A8F2|nr:hypothetical protein [Streptomyces sp. NBRC 110611]GAU65553.1 hypothetical protein SSP35_01_08970 [Streptomyces sp. NBRC 110611]